MKNKRQRTAYFGSDRQSMLTKERRSLWFDWFDRLTNQRLLSLSKYTNRLSKRP
jgi:hypothetical protein